MEVTERQGFFKAFSILKNQDEIAPPGKLPWRKSATFPPALQ
jgi:hypothetical protein